MRRYRVDRMSTLPLQGGIPMSRTLKMAPELLDIGRRFLACGRDQEALTTLGKIPQVAGVSSDVTVESQLQLAQIYLRRRKFALARRHLNVVLACDPASGEAHYFLASSFFQDDERDLRRAAKHFRRAVELEPHEPAFAADYGLCLLDLGRTTAGLRLLQRAVELAPDDVEYVRDLALSLLTAERPVEARRVVLAALFRQPGNAEARKLWNEIRFHVARLEQSNRVRPYKSDESEEPVLLPFRRHSHQIAGTSPAIHGTLKFPSASHRAELLKRLRKKRRQSS